MTSHTLTCILYYCFKMGHFIKHSTWHGALKCSWWWRFWGHLVMMQCTDVGGHTHTQSNTWNFFQNAMCRVTSLHPKDGGSMVLQKVGVLPQHYTLS